MVPKVFYRFIISLAILMLILCSWGVVETILKTINQECIMSVRIGGQSKRVCYDPNYTGSYFSAIVTNIACCLVWILGIPYIWVKIKKR